MEKMSNYWTVFVVVSALIICLVLEVSIVNVSWRVSHLPDLLSSPWNEAHKFRIVC